ncbi:unnamed protein product, partial [Brassica oleracea]
ANPNFSCPNTTKKKSTCRSSDNAKLFRNTVYLLYTPNGHIPLAFNGSISLANTHLSIPSQLVSMYKLFPPKMSLCLPSSQGMGPYSGDLWIGGGPPFKKDVSTIFASTPLVGNNKSGENLIDVKSIQIGGKTVPILNGATKICTQTPYTVLHTSIYNALVTAFIGTTKMAKVPAVKPFGACFLSNGGRAVPVIDLVLGGGAKWRIHGSNSLVKVNKNVVCLWFVDGGVKTKNPILLGGFQLEDNLVEFDLKASKFSFSSSLLLHNTSCTRDRLFGM